MPGTLHIFRLKAEPLQYQVNYNPRSPTCKSLTPPASRNSCFTARFPARQRGQRLAGGIALQRAHDRGRGGPSGVAPGRDGFHPVADRPVGRSPDLLAEDPHVFAALIDVDAKRVQRLIQLVALQLHSASRLIFIGQLLGHAWRQNADQADSRAHEGKRHAHVDVGVAILHQNPHTLRAGVGPEPS